MIGAGFFGIEHFTPPWDVFYLPLFNLLVLAYRLLFSDFAIAIIVFTVVIRTILAPLFVQQIRSQREMQRMQPLIREVQRKHKGNSQKIQQETMALYREHGVNPAGGCLPLILQLPILYSLYQALIRASGVVQNFVPNSGDQAAFDALKSAGVIHAIADQANHYQVAVSGPCDLSQYNQLPQFLPLNCQLLQPLHLDQTISTMSGWLVNPFNSQHMHLNLATPDQTFAIVIGGFGLSALALIAAILQFVQVKMTSPRPNPDDPTSGATSTMTYLFPLLTIFWGGLFPSGLILYWIVYTAYLVGHQFLMMGWGNLFPIFGWSPGFAGVPQDTTRLRGRAATAEPARERDESGRSPSLATAPTGAGSASGGGASRASAGSASRASTERTSSQGNPGSQRGQAGQRGGGPQRSGSGRSGPQRKRGRKR